MHRIAPASPHANIIPSLGVEDKLLPILGCAAPDGLLVRLRPSGRLVEGEALSIPAGMSPALRACRSCIDHTVAPQAHEDVGLLSHKGIDEARLAVSAIPKGEDITSRCRMNLQELAHLLTSQSFRVLPCSHPAHTDKRRPGRCLRVLLRQIGQKGIPVAYGHWLVARNLGRIHISPVLKASGMGTWVGSSVHSKKVETSLLLLWKVGDIQAQKGAFGKPESVHSLVKGAVMALSECGKECQLHRGANPHRTCQGVHHIHDTISSIVRA